MHASAGVLDGVMCIAGGLDKGLAPRREILAVRADGSVHRAGTLPQPLSDAGVTTVGDRLIVIGGRGEAGPVSSVLSVQAAP
jgi:hypothetical protein